MPSVWWLIEYSFLFGITFSICLPRILRDHSDSSGIQNQVLEGLRVRLQEAELSLKHEQEAHQQSRVRFSYVCILLHKASVVLMFLSVFCLLNVCFSVSQTENSERQSKLESEQRSMAETVKTLQKNNVEERRIFFRISLFLLRVYYKKNRHHVIFHQILVFTCS